MNVKIDIDTRTFVRFGLVVVAFIIGALIIYRSFSALVVLAVSLFLALALNPSVSMIAKRLPSRSRVGATAIAYLLVLSVLAGIAFLVVPPVVEQTSKFAQTVPGLIDQITDQRSVFEDFVNRYNLNDQVDQSVENAKDQAASLAANLGNVLVNGAGAIFNGAATMLFVLVLTFLMLIEGPGWLERIWGLYHDHRRLKKHQALVKRMYRVVSGYVNGQMLVALIAAACTLVSILILSAIFPLPANLAIPLAAIVFVTGLVPMIGATIGAVLVGLVLMLNSFVAAIIFLIYFIIYQQIENNFISPAVQSKTVELSALTVLAAILIGINLFGILGGLISIPIAGCLRVLAVHYLEYARDKREQQKRLAVKAEAKAAK